MLEDPKGSRSHRGLPCDPTRMTALRQCEVGYAGNTHTELSIPEQGISCCRDIHIHNLAALGAWVGIRDW